MSILKLFRFLISLLLGLFIIFIIGNCQQKKPKSTESNRPQNIDFDEINKSFYDKLKQVVIEGEPIKTYLMNIDSAIIYVIPIKKCFSCLGESYSKLEQEHFSNDIERIILTINDSSTSQSLNFGHSSFKDFKIFSIKDKDFKNSNLLEIVRIYYIKNGNSTINIVN